MADIVDDFLTRLVRHAPDLPLDTRIALERDIRYHHGGANGGDISIGVDGLSKTTRTFIVSMGLRHKTPMREIFAKVGGSRSTFYRILRSK